VLHVFANRWASCDAAKTQDDVIHTLKVVTHDSILDSIPQQISNKAFVLKENVNVRKVLSFENVVRYGRDYGSDPLFYHYLVQNNRSAEYLPETIAALDDSGQLMAIIYLTPTTFIIAKRTITGVMLAGWRKLPSSNPFSASAVMMSAIRQSPISSSHNPVRDTYAAYDGGGWKCAHAIRYWLPVDGECPFRSGEVQIYTKARFPGSVIALLDEENLKYEFGMKRSPELYQSRLDKFAAATSSYMVQSKNDKPVGILALMATKPTIAIVDFACRDADVFYSSLANVYEYARKLGKKWIVFQTSLEDIIQREGNLTVHRRYKIPTYYYINTQFAKDREDIIHLAANWENISQHQTMICGDVLIKPGADCP
jgi:hypothetical protein